MSEIIQDKFEVLDLPEFFHEINNYNMTTRRLNDKKQFCEFIQWGRRNPSRFAEEVFNVQLLDYQRYCFDMSWTTPFVVWAESRNAGKALSLDTPILRPDGTYSLIKDIKEGDYVVGDDGEPTKVLATSPIFYGHDCYKITFADDEVIIADAEHIWSVYESRSAKRDIIKNKTTQELAQKYYRYKRNGKYKEYLYSVPQTAPIKYTEKQLPIDPYILGIWLGDGGKHHGEITSGATDYKCLIENIERVGYKIHSIHSDRNENKRIFIHDNNDKPLITLLKDNGLKCNKHIPHDYKYGSIEQRMALVQGLMDTDGTCDKRGICDFYQKDYDLISDFSEILNSLGIKNRIFSKYTKTSKDSDKYFKSYRCSFVLDKNHSCFRLPRKHSRLKDHLRRHQNRKVITNIEKVDSVPTKCLCVDNMTHRFLCGKKNTVTHNSILASLFVMSKLLLIPNFTCYLLAGVGSQSIELFTKMEQFAKKQIASFAGLNDIFQNNVVKNQANSDGWVHNPASYKVSLYNNSRCFTLNGAFDNNRSKRSNLNVYD